MNNVNPTATSDERLLAALAHGSVLLSFFGPLVPALLWTFQRRKSSYVAFHALQAMGYQMLTFWLGMAVYLLLMIVMMAAMLPVIALIEENTNNPVAGMFAVEGSFFILMLGFFAGYFLVGLAGAALCLMGRDFKVPFLGKRLERYLGRGANPSDVLDEAQAEQWVAGVCHGSAILLIWGMFLPLAVWLAEKDKSPRLCFQALQAFAYQLAAVLAYFGFMAVYMITFMGLFAVMLLLPTMGNGQEFSSAAMVAFLVFMFVMLLLMLVMMLAVPTYHLFAMIAGIQVVKGRDYRYPLLGNFIARRLGNESSGG